MRHVGGTGKQSENCRSKIMIKEKSEKEIEKW